MRVEIIYEAGYEAALLGLGFSYGVTSNVSYNEFLEDEVLMSKTARRAEKLAGMNLGHDKFLRVISVIIDVDAPRYWWQEADQYKVSTTTLSESTMHTITHTPFASGMFEPLSDGTPSVPPQIIEFLERKRLKLLKIKEETGVIERSLWEQLISCLPQSFLQRRLLCVNYQTLINIVEQRKNHKLKQWHLFCESVYSQVQHPEFFKSYRQELQKV